MNQTHFLFKDIKDKKIIYLNSSMMGLDEVVLSVGRNKQNLKYVSRKVALISPDDLLSNVDKTGAEFYMKHVEYMFKIITIWWR